MDNLKIRNGVLITPEGIVKGGLSVKDGRISSLGPDVCLPAAVEEVDARGLIVMPGLIDPHLHLGLGAMPGRGEEKFASDVHTESISAAVGGVTTIVSTALFWDAGRGPILPCISRAKDLGAEHSLVDFKLTAFVMNDTHIREIPELVEAGVHSFKFLMGYRGEEGRQVGASGIDLSGIDWGFAFKGFETIARVSPPGVAMVHAEAAEVISITRARVSSQGREDLVAWAESRPALAEAMDVATASVLAIETGVPVYFPHVSSRQALEVAEALRELRARIYVETCPQYLTMTRDTPVGNYGKVNPPLRQQQDVEALWAAVNRGMVDTIGSDHCAYQRYHKAGSLWECPPGFGGVGAILPLLITHGVKRGRLSWEGLARITAENTARIFGMYPRKGALAVGFDADFVLIDPDHEWVLGPDALCSASDFSVYEGQQVIGRAVQTYVRGIRVAENGTPVHNAPHGRFV